MPWGKIQVSWWFGLHWIPLVFQSHQTQWLLFVSFNLNPVVPADPRGISHRCFILSFQFSTTLSINLFLMTSYQSSFWKYSCLGVLGAHRQKHPIPPKQFNEFTFAKFPGLVEALCQCVYILYILYTVYSCDQCLLLLSLASMHRCPGGAEPHFVL